MSNDSKLRKGPEEPATDFEGSRYYPSQSSHKMRFMARRGLGEVGALQAEVAKLSRTEKEDPTAPTPRHIVSKEDVTHGIISDQVDQARIQDLIEPLDARFTQKEQTQRIFHARGRLVEALRAPMFAHISSDARQEIVRRAVAFWKRTAQTDYGKEPTVRYEGGTATMKSEQPKLVIGNPKARADGKVAVKYQGLVKGELVYTRGDDPVAALRNLRLEW